MSGDDFNSVLQMLKSGQNPTPPHTGNSGLSTSLRNNSGTREVDFGLRPFTEKTSADNTNPSSGENK